jgi:hypothetical protein
MFALLEREQELFTQAIEERIDSIDFSGFWQAVEVQLAESSLSWRTRVRLWYEMWQSTWAFPVPAWAVATLLLSLVSTHIFRNNFPLIPSPPNSSPGTSPAPTTPPVVVLAPDEESHEPTPIQKVGLGSNQIQDDNSASIESLSTSGSGEIAIQIQHDAASNSTLIIWHGASEYTQ